MRQFYGSLSQHEKIFQMLTNEVRVFSCQLREFSLLLIAVRTIIAASHFISTAQSSSTEHGRSMLFLRFV